MRCLLAALMLLTGLLGQAGHAAMHAGGDGSAAWLAALQAERSWLAGEPDAQATAEIFGGGERHHHGNGPAHQHDGPDGLLADHAHCVVFLAPAGPALGPPSLEAGRSWAVSCRLAGGQPDHLDRPPRRAATRA